MSVRRGAVVMASGTAVSRVLGLLRGMVLVAAIGTTGQAADAFSVANKLPNTLYMLLAGGVLNAVLVPQVVRAYKRDAGQAYVDRLLSFGFVVLAAATVLLTAAAPWLVTLYSSPASQAQADLAVTFAYWCIPQLFFYGAYALLGQVLNARGSFGPFMWAPIANNLVSIAGFGVFIAVFGSVGESGLRDAAAWGTSQVALLAGVATLGVVAQAVVLVPALRRAGVHYRFRWGWRGAGLGTAGRVATWTVLALAIGQLSYIVVSRVATAAGGSSPDGGVAGNAVYDNAFLVFMLPHSLVTVSLATALFTRLSAQVHDEDVDGARRSLSQGVRVVAIFTLLATAVVAVLAAPISRLVQPAATPTEVDAIAVVVVLMILGLPAFGTWSLCQRVYYAQEDARGLVPIQAVMAAVVIGGTLLTQATLDPAVWVGGAGLSMSVSYVVGALLALAVQRRRLHGVDGRRMLRTHVKATLAALVAAALGLGVLVLVRSVGPDGLVGAATQCVVVGTVMAVVYVALLRLMRTDELDTLLGPVLRRLRRR